MPAKKSSKKSKVTKKSSSSKGNSLLAEYCRQRDKFYEDHPRARVLLGLLIVSFAMALGVLYYNKNIVFVGLSLDTEYGIRYPYVDVAKGAKY